MCAPKEPWCAPTFLFVFSCSCASRHVFNNIDHRSLETNSIGRTMDRILLPSIPFSYLLLFLVRLHLSLSLSLSHTHTHSHTRINIYIYICAQTFFSPLPHYIFLSPPVLSLNVPHTHTSILSLSLCLYGIFPNNSNCHSANIFMNNEQPFTKQVLDDSRKCCGCIFALVRLLDKALEAKNY